MDDINQLIRKPLVYYKTHQDEVCLFTFFTVFLISWTIAAGFLPSSTELDSTEEVVWSQSWQWGYYKHPPLPSALLHLMNVLFSGPSLAIIAFTSQLCTVTALFFVWLLGKQLMSDKQAIVAVLITSLIAYHNTRALTFNHNTVSLPFTAAAWYFFYCGIQTPQRITSWFWLGVVCGLAMLTKYSALLVLTTFFIYLTWQRLWFKPYIIRGLLVSCGIFVLVISPHVIWLSEHHWLPFTYIHDKLEISGNRFSIIGRFWCNQIIRLSFVFPLLLALWFLCKKNIIKVTSQKYTTRDNRDKNGFYLLTILFSPLVLAMMPTLITGSMLNSNWISAFFLPSGLVITYYGFNRFNDILLLKYTHFLTWLSQAIILLLFFFTALIYPGSQGKAKRLNFPGQILTNKVHEIWTRHQQQPLSIIVSNTWIGGNLLLHLRPEPSVFVDYTPIESPWVSSQDLDACGGFIIINKDKYNPQSYRELFKQASVSGEFSIDWGHIPQGRQLHYRWAIKSPQNKGQFCRFTHPR